MHKQEKSIGYKYQFTKECSQIVTLIKKHFTNKHNRFTLKAINTSLIGATYA